MIAVLLGLHGAAVAIVALVGDRLGRAVFAVAALPALVTASWGVTRLGERSAVTAEVEWVSGLDLGFAFSVGPLSALMTVVVAGIGVAVFVYAGGYFGADATGMPRMAATLVGFAASMLGLVWADSVWTLFVFWELTSITSFLLVGFKDTDPAARLAARRALLITAAGGLVLLAGLVVLVDATATSRLSEMGAVDGTRGVVAAVLVAVAAATKSAQVPFHVWLPGAMAAPTPVSAYLHSATMVKAGVLLVALVGPVLGDVGVWKVAGLTFGIVSMMWGAVGALRHVDAKLILAWGTVSQLGLMITLLALGTAKATFAALSILTAHAVFKAALFMVVGEIDVRTGSRDIRHLSGLRRSMPVTAAVAVAAGLSMAGVPPLLGFPAKEAAIEAVLGLSGPEAWVVGGAVIVGSALTVAYTVRLVAGLFGGDGGPTPVGPRRPAMAVPAAVLGFLGVAGFAGLGAVTEMVRPAAVGLDPDAAVYELVRWPGLTEAFVVSMVVVAAGGLVGWLIAARRLAVPRPWGADAADRLTDGVLVVARLLTGRVQHGSLPFYLATMALTAALAAVPFVVAVDLDTVRAWDSVIQAVLAVLIVAAAVAAARVGSRLGAALGLGAVGIAVSGLFAVHGAPDLALTQLLVETVVVVGFVIGLGHLSRRFPPVGHVWRSVRFAVAGAAGLAVGVALVASASGPTGEPPLAALTEGAVEDGGGNNIVNVILTDVRALDTLGEIVVLVVVAVGVLALARPSRPSSEAMEDGA